MDDSFRGFAGYVGPHAPTLGKMVTDAGVGVGRRGDSISHVEIGRNQW